MAKNTILSETVGKLVKETADQKMAAMNKKYGAGSVRVLNDKSTIPHVERIPSGVPSLDLILDGGLPKGRIIQMYGLQSSGKTSLSITFLAQAQKLGRVAFIDIENSFDPDYAMNLGLDLDNLFYAQPNSGEEALDIIENLMLSGEMSMLVLDSVANLTTIAANEKAIDGSANIATTARLLSQNLPRLNRVASKTGTTLVFINQIRMKIGEMYGNPETVPGGLALSFNNSLTLKIRKTKAEVRNGREGIPVHIKVEKSKVSPPFRTTETFLFFGTGFDYTSDLMAVALTTGLINKAGGWYSYGVVDTPGFIKENGWDKFVAKLHETPKIMEEIGTKLLKN